MDRHSLFISSDRNRPFLDGTEFSIATICNANDDSDHIETVIEDFDLSFYIEQHEISFPGSHCNGIICLCGFGRNNILVFNPALREFKLMTSSCFGPWKRRKQKLLVGLGHDIIDNVYKVIRVVYVNCEFLGAEIHTLGIDHHDMWREINIEVEFCQVCTPRFMNQDVEYKGIVYWLAGGCCSGNPMIVSFDVHDEKFKTIALPAADDELSTNDACLERTYKLALWNGFVTLFKFYRQICDCIEGSTCPSRKTIEMWVMRDGFCKDPANKNSGVGGSGSKSAAGEGRISGFASGGWPEVMARLRDEGRSWGKLASTGWKSSSEKEVVAGSAKVERKWRRDFWEGLGEIEN
ncbi:hypothetical protein TIFTF001_041037 [Ficus carica]|uniref:F-box associated beta-propeller type 3 domain-containing protein n=1 Tax=Ficus carica TaxID=3494 RepID=A0AA87Z126_FICCA|nr:hypothetical protein TIFTF001_041037 [Ficus carica]